MSLSSRGVKEMGQARHVVFDCDGTLLNIEQGGKPYEGIPELLHRLNQLDIQLSVWTGRDRPSTLRLLQEHGLLRFFADIRSASDTTAKPHPQGLKELLLDVLPASSAVVGDTWADMRGAKLHGSWAVGALWNSQASREALEEFGADALVSTPAECYDALLRLLQG